MNRQTFLFFVIVVALIYLSMLLYGFADFEQFKERKELVDVAIAIPAALLAYVFQQRANTVAETRLVLAELSDALQVARTYASGGSVESALVFSVLKNAEERFESLFKTAKAGQNVTPLKLLTEVKRIVERAKQATVTEAGASRVSDEDLDRFDDAWSDLRKLLAFELDTIGSWYFVSSPEQVKRPLKP